MTTALCLVAVVFSFGIQAQAGHAGVVSFPHIDAFQQITTGTGWILFDGKLYWTEDDGAAWVDITPSPADIQAVDFINTARGWAITSRTNGFTLAWTRDAGHAWRSRALNLPALADLDAPIGQVFMDWRTNSHGWLVFKLATGSNFSRGILFVTTDGGISWIAHDIPLAEPVTFTDKDHGWISGGPAGDQFFKTQDGGLTWEPAPGSGDHPPLQDKPGFVERSMSAPGMGWAKWQSGECTGAVCVREVKLLGTRNGVHWKALRLPNAQTSLRQSHSSTMKSAFMDTDTTAYVGHGFDTCEIPDLEKMQTWWNSSPYTAVNLYIGGISRGCSNSALTSSFLSTLNAQGWRFIPTWVGPQAYCSVYAHKMSENKTTAYNEGVAEANLAIAAAQALGLTEADGSGTVIYYDLEAYNVSDQDCRDAANAFINGWTSQLRARGNLAGVYGAAYGSAVSDWWSIPNIPDAVWIAHWLGNAGSVSFMPDASVFGSAYVNDAFWSNHQRLRQYAGGHNETWGGLTINIDSNVLDGPLTVRNGTAGTSAPSIPSYPSPANNASLGRTSDTWLRWKTNGDTCSVHVWGGALDTNLSSPCSLHHLGVQAPGAYSWQVTATNGFGVTVGPVWGFNIRPAAPTGLTALTVSATRVDLAWTASTDLVDNYLIYADGLQVAILPGTATSFQVQNLACNTVHSFYVKGTRGGILSDASNTASATTASCAPVLVSPLGVVVKSLQPAFTWGSVEAATRYQLQVSAYSNFASPSINKWTPATSYTHPLPLLANKLYYWRVRAYGAFGWGDWGSASFTTPNPPPAPLLISPVNNSLVTDYTPRFDWRDVVLPAGTRLHHYQIQVASSSTFASLVQNKNTLLSVFTPLTGLLPNRTYYWRVRAVNTRGQAGPWSMTGSFRTAILPPILLSPAHASTLTDRRPAFDWKDAPGAGSYNLQLSLTSNFTRLLLNTRTLASGYTMPFDLPVNLTLYWRVRAFGLNGPSLWSARWRFTTGGTSSLPLLGFNW